jgi:hypothetical protein
VSMNAVQLTILMPCLNEAKTLPTCIRKAQAFLSRRSIPGEILIADNGSTDGSVELGQALGATIISVAARGYGNALRAGIEAARGTYIIMGDADDSYDFRALEGFVAKLEEGYDLVVGNRFAGGIQPRAMPPLHRYFGNPLLTLVGRAFFGSPVNDFYCGLRGFSREAVRALALTSPGMEFALEMIVKASIRSLRITEVPTTLSRDGRNHAPHLRTFRDGWRSLRFYLLMCPRWLFLYPGLILTLFAGATSCALTISDLRIGSVVFAHHSLILTCAMTSIGIQSVFFWALARTVAAQKGLLRPDPVFDGLRARFTLERCLAFGLALVICGLAIAVYALIYWYQLSFGEIRAIALVKIVSVASFLTVLGFQLIFSSFFQYLLDQSTETHAKGEEHSYRDLTTPASA